jgi:hypothetical protein
MREMVRFDVMIASDSRFHILFFIFKASKGVILFRNAGEFARAGPPDAEWECVPPALVATD